MFKKIIFIAIIIFNFFIPILVSAQVTGANSQIAELNPFCWKKKDCVDVRRGFVTGDPTDEELAKDGFISNASVAPCMGGEGDEQWGRCLPAGVTKTEIDFGGRSEFSNIGDFILVMYKWLVTVASIVAVIMIIVAGIQWITSGGNSEAISSAKHRISGAVVGLFIAYMSYFILNTINPNLVNFRLPQVWMVRPTNLMPEYCSDIPNYDKFKYAYLFDEDKQHDALPPSNQLEYKPIREHDTGLCCGCVFLTQTGGSSKCLGDYCQEEKQDGVRRVCATNESDKHQCYVGDLHIRLSFSSDIGDSIKRSLGNAPVVGLLTAKAMDDDWITGQAVIRAVCKRSTDGVIFLSNSGQGVPWVGDRRELVKHKKQNNYFTYDDVFRGLVIEEGKDSFARDAFLCIESKGAKYNVNAPKDINYEIVGYFIRYELAAQQSWYDNYKITLASAFTARAIVSFLVPGAGWAKFSATLGGAAIGWLIDDGPPRPNLNVGYQDGRAVFGVYAGPTLRANQPQWEEMAAIKNLDGYIPMEQMKRPGGLRLEINVNLQDFAIMMLHRNSVPEIQFEETNTATP